MKYELNRIATFSMGIGVTYFLGYIERSPFAAIMGLVVCLLWAVLAGISDER